MSPILASNLSACGCSITKNNRSKKEIKLNSSAAIIFGKTRQAVLTQLFEQPERSAYLRKLSRQTGIGPGTPQHEPNQVLPTRCAPKSSGEASPLAASGGFDPISYPMGSESPSGFHPNLSWSHYRALMRVENSAARQFYETEAVQSNWSRRDLERQIGSLFYERLLASADKTAMLEGIRQEAIPLNPLDMLKDPYVLEFLDLPSVPQLQECQLEQAIIDKLQHFLLELGRGFSFVARQKRMRFDDKDFYVDLVFYNYLLKCFVLIDLKIGELSHQDIGQMDGYVRMYEAHAKVEGDNPTIGLILCSEKNAAIARYSVLSDSQQLFATKYQFTLPSEDELQREILRERALIENQQVEYVTSKNAKKVK